MSDLHSTVENTATQHPRSSPLFSGEDLKRRTVERRALEAVIWGIPAVNYDLMRQAMIQAGGSLNEIVYWSRLLDWKNQTLTPNPDTIYLMPFFSTRDVGPMVMEIPPAGDGSITGTIMDCWQVPLEDVGPAGVDKGKGGKYLILTPDFADQVPDGYIPLPSANYQGYALLRSILKSRSDADIAAAVAYGKQIKLYPLSQAANPARTTMIDATGVLFDATIPYDLRFFQSLDRLVQAEPWLERDRAWIDPLKSVGIEKGKPFKLDEKHGEVLASAAREARAWFDDYYESTYEPYNSGTRWFVPADTELMEATAANFTLKNSYPTDRRGATYYFAFSGIKHVGAGQFYLFTSRDKDGQPLDGACNHRLHVPAKPPVKQYWSAVLYDFATHTLIRDMAWSSRSSLASDLKANSDGSVDVFFGPVAPKGQETNWIPTSPNGRFEVIFRLYGPAKALFDKSWVLPDIEKMK